MPDSFLTRARYLSYWTLDTHTRGLRVRCPVFREADTRVDLTEQHLARLERGLLAWLLVLYPLLRIIAVELRELEQHRTRRALVQVGALAQDGVASLSGRVLPPPLRRLPILRHPRVQLQ